MKRIAIFLFAALASLTLQAQVITQTTHKGVKSGGYPFWVSLPDDYLAHEQPFPVVFFLHGASLCGNNLSRVKTYGTLAAIGMGRKIPAIVVAPQNPGGAWSPKKLDDILEWTKKQYRVDTTRVSVLGMSLGGYGTMDFAGTYPHKIAAAMALCGGCSLKDQSGLGELPLWIIHGTGDRAVSVKESQKVVNLLKSKNADKRLRFDWLPGASHGAPARIFYLKETYEWLLSHSLDDPDRPVNRHVIINQNKMANAYSDLITRRRR